MYCPKCGAMNDQNAWKCVECGAELPHGEAQPMGGEPMGEPMGQPMGGPMGGPMGVPPPKINNYLVPSILVTIFCCWPLGIPAIIFAAQANSKMGQGDYDGAVQSAEKAKTWTWIAFGAGLLIGIAYFAIGVLGAAGQ